MGELSPWHWLVVIGVFALLFGAKRLPDAARSLGRSTRILKSELSGLREDDKPAAAAPASVVEPEATAVVSPVAVDKPQPATG
jgi:sec-independent protein translocase protein TatA